ncbi:hypothetical protein J0S82_016978, partial [Galemys pyrenaicus]
HADHKAHHSKAVVKFNDVPGIELDKVVEGNASPSIKGGRVGFTIKAGDNMVLNIVQDVLKGALRCLVHHLLEVTVFSNLLPMADQNHNIRVGASELPIELREDLAHNLWAQVEAGMIDGMDFDHGSHKAKAVIDDTGHGDQAVDEDAVVNTAGVVILLMVHAHHKHGSISERGRDNDPFGTTL